MWHVRVGRASRPPLTRRLRSGLACTLRATIKPVARASSLCETSVYAACLYENLTANTTSPKRKRGVGWHWRLARQWRASSLRDACVYALGLYENLTANTTSPKRKRGVGWHWRLVRQWRASSLRDACAYALPRTRIGLPTQRAPSASEGFKGRHFVGERLLSRERSSQRTHQSIIPRRMTSVS